MAETGDRRSAGKTLTPQQRAARELREYRAARGLCKVCGKVHVKGRMVCERCSDDSIMTTRLSNFRKHLEMFDVDHEGMIDLLSDVPGATRLVEALIAGRKKRRKA